VLISLAEVKTKEPENLEMLRKFNQKSLLVSKAKPQILRQDELRDRLQNAISKIESSQINETLLNQSK
jgi:hypothetical protein